MGDDDDEEEEEEEEEENRLMRAVKVLYGRVYILLGWQCGVISGVFGTWAAPRCFFLTCPAWHYVSISANHHSSNYNYVHRLQFPSCPVLSLLYFLSSSSSSSTFFLFNSNNNLIFILQKKMNVT